MQKFVLVALCSLNVGLFSDVWVSVVRGHCQFCLTQTSGNLNCEWIYVKLNLKGRTKKGTDWDPRAVKTGKCAQEAQGWEVTSQED